MPYQKKASRESSQNEGRRVTIRHPSIMPWEGEAESCSSRSPCSAGGVAYQEIDQRHDGRLEQRHRQKRGPPAEAGNGGGERGAVADMLPILPMATMNPEMVANSRERTSCRRS